MARILDVGWSRRNDRALLEHPWLYGIGYGVVIGAIVLLAGLAFDGELSGSTWERAAIWALAFGAIGALSARFGWWKGRAERRRAARETGRSVNEDEFSRSAHARPTHSCQSAWPNSGRLLAMERERHRSVVGTTAMWNDEEGWGALASPEVEGEMWAHFSDLILDGYRSLRVGQGVRFEYEAPGQDGIPTAGSRFNRSERVTADPACGGAEFAHQRDRLDEASAAGRARPPNASRCAALVTATRVRHRPWQRCGRSIRAGSARVRLETSRGYPAAADDRGRPPSFGHWL